jgi:hypothetical protein
VILTGKKLDELGTEIWGPEWAAVLSGRLRLTKKRLFRWRDKPDHAIPADIRDAIMRLAEDQLMATAKWVDAFRDRDMDAA